MSMKAYELMKLAVENPEAYEGKKYKVIAGTAMALNGRKYGTINVGSNGAFRAETGLRLYVSDNTVVEEIKPKPVPFIEAVKAYRDGKSITCEWRDLRSVYNLSCGDTAMFKDVNCATLTAGEILDGTWYIEEG